MSCVSRGSGPKKNVKTQPGGGWGAGGDRQGESGWLPESFTEKREYTFYNLE